MDLDGEDASDACLLLGDDETPAVPPSLMCSAPVMDLCFHPQLPILAAGLVTGEVEIYECTDQETIKKPMQNDFGSWIFGPNKTYSEQDDIVLNYHHQNMRMHPSGGISSMEFTDDGVYLVSASSDRTISVMDCVSARLVIHINASQMESLSEKSKKKLKTPVPSRRKPLKRGKKGAAAMEVVNPHKHGVSALNVCDENLIATGDDDGLIAIWDMRERRPVHTYHEHADYVSQLCYFTDVAELVSSSGDTCLGVYDLRGARIRDFSEKRKDEISCFAFINASGANSSSFIPSILCGTPTGTLPMWKYGSWRRPYDAMEYHPKECESIISFHGEDTAFNHNLVLTGACDGLVRVIQMYPLRRNLCQLSARDYSYNHANSSTGSGGSGSSSYHNSNFITKKKRGHEGIRHMRLRHDSRVLAVSGTDNIVDFVDVRFLTDEKMLDELRGKAERRHMTTIRNMEREKAETEERERLAAEAGSDDSDDDDDDDDDDDSSSDDGNMAAKFARREVARKAAKRATAKVVDDAQPTRKTKKAPATVVAAAPERTPDDYMEEIKLDRQTKRERVAAAKWLKLEKKKKIHFGFEKRRRRVGGFFGDMANGGGE